MLIIIAVARLLEWAALSFEVNVEFRMLSTLPTTTTPPTTRSLFFWLSSCCSSFLLSLLTLTDGCVSRLGGFASLSLLSPSSTSISDRDLLRNDEFDVVARQHSTNNLANSHCERWTSLQISLRIFNSSSRSSFCCKLSATDFVFFFVPVELCRIFMFNPPLGCWLESSTGASSPQSDSDPATGRIGRAAAAATGVDDATGDDDDDSVEFSAFFDFTLLGMLLEICTRNIL